MEQPGLKFVTSLEETPQNSNVLSFQFPCIQSTTHWQPCPALVTILRPVQEENRHGTTGSPVGHIPGGRHHKIAMPSYNGTTHSHSCPVLSAWNNLVSGVSHPWRRCRKITMPSPHSKHNTRRVAGPSPALFTMVLRPVQRRYGTTLSPVCHFPGGDATI
jgi:hypothetical protein